MHEAAVSGDWVEAEGPAGRPATPRSVLGWSVGRRIRPCARSSPPGQSRQRPARTFPPQCDRGSTVSFDTTAGTSASRRTARAVISFEHVRSGQAGWAAFTIPSPPACPWTWAPGASWSLLPSVSCVLVRHQGYLPFPPARLELISSWPKLASPARSTQVMPWALTSTMRTLPQAPGTGPRCPEPTGKQPAQPLGLVAPQAPQVLLAPVISVPKTSISRPPMALPSIASISALLPRRTAWSSRLG